MPAVTAMRPFFLPLPGSQEYKKPVNTSVYGLSLTPRVGLEPTTTRLTAECSTIELSRIIIFEGHNKDVIT